MAVPKSPVGCPMDSLLRLLMGPWTTYILWVLRSNGPTRFGELKRKVPGVSAKVLTERLRMLAEAGVVHRRFEATIPPQVTYSLTARGEDGDERTHQAQGAGDELGEVGERRRTVRCDAAELLGERCPIVFHIPQHHRQRQEERDGPARPELPAAQPHSVGTPQSEPQQDACTDEEVRILGEQSEASECTHREPPACAA